MAAIDVGVTVRGTFYESWDGMVGKASDSVAHDLSMRSGLLQK